MQSVAAALALLAVTVTGGTGIDTGSAAEPTGALELLGELAKPSAATFGVNFYVVGFDPAAKRLYVKHRASGVPTKMATYDLSSTIPKLLSTVDFPTSTFTVPHFTTALAPPRNRFYTISTTLGAEAAITSVDLAGKPATHTWPMEQKFPGFFPSGLTYSAEDDRLYAVGEMSGTYFVLDSTATVGRKPAGILPTVAAFDPDNGDLLWARPIPECGQVLYTLHNGSAVARSSPAVPTPTIVFACGTGSVLDGDTMPGQAGVVELRITPTAKLADAAGFDLDFHPISGAYFNGGQAGFSYYDGGSDRLFVQSLSATTPGAWVFDARHGAWAGFITAPTNQGNYGGVNQGSGHYYMGGGGANGFVLVADGRATPPQSGVLGDKRFVPNGFVFGDPTSDRVFLNPASDRIYVLRDRTASVAPLERPDYDAQTDDVDETPGTFVSFSGETGGFGARVTAVGDTSAVVGPVPLGVLVARATPASTRGALFARVPAASVQPAGASASAQAVSSDTTTGQAVDQHGVAWPFEPRTCLDGGSGDVGETKPAESVGGRAEVRCTLAAYESAGSARQSGVSTGPVSVGDSRVDSRVKRTAAGGMVTTTTSSTSGVRVEVPGVGSLEIGSVEVVAATSAHGRSGTASATWTRSLKGVAVKDATGKELFRTDGCSTTIAHNGKKATASGDAGTCEALADTVRRLLQVRVRLLFPTAAVTATSKGAFARVGQSDTDLASEVTVNDQGKVFAGDTTTRRAVPGLQINVYNDSTERSRYIVQLAGVETSSIYTVNKSADDAPCDMGGCIPGGFDGPLPTDSETSVSGGPVETAAPSLDAIGVEVPTAPVALAGGRGGSRAAGESGLDGLILARRSLGDGGLMASFVLLAAAAAGAVARRRRLLALLDL